MAADAFGRYFPLLTTAAGTAKPANVLILGVGVAGLQAIATARRLGAVVKAYDVRAETKEQAESLGAQFLKLESVADATRRGRLRARAHRRRAQGPAGGARQAHRRHGRRHHHGPGAGPSPATARDRERGARHEGGLGHRGHGRQRAGRQRRALRAGRHHRDRERRDHHRARRTCRPPCPAAPAASTPATSARCWRTSSRTGRCTSTSTTRSRPARSSRTTARSCIPATAELLAPAQGGPGMNGEISLLGSLVIFVLAVLVGFEVISKVPATLHTPLMSGANSIHGIVLIGGMIIAATATDLLGYLLAAIAVVFGAMNVVGGYVVTDRMLQMFRKRPTAPRADSGNGGLGRVAGDARHHRHPRRPAGRQRLRHRPPLHEQPGHGALGQPPLGGGHDPGRGRDVRSRSSCARAASPPRASSSSWAASSSVAPWACCWRCAWP